MRRPTREWTVEEYEAWSKATDRFDAVAKATDEEGGPRLSLVPVTERGEVWPTDLLAPAQDAPAPGDDSPDAPNSPDAPDAPAENVAEGVADSPPPAAQPFDGIPLEDSRKRMAGWCAERQRLFLANLAETGSVHLASAAARLSARSAYRLRARSPAFARAFDVAQQLAVGRLSALAFDHAIHGRIEKIWQEGVLVAEKQVPSDKLLMWLLARLDPRRFAAPWELRKDEAPDPQAAAIEAFPALLEGLEDEVA